MLFLLPLTINDLGVNYTFLLLPALLVAVDEGLRKPPDRYLHVMVLYTVIFLAALLYQHELYPEAVRRTISFGLYMSMFAYLFIRIDQEIIAAFKDALVLMSVLLSAVSISVLLAAGAADLDLEPAKNLVGSQRVGFMYLIALWLVYADKGHAARYRLTKLALLAVLVAGLLLTFSRTSILALAASAGLFAMVQFMKWLRRPQLRTLWLGLLSVCGFAILGVFLYLAFPLAFDFFDQRLLKYFERPELLSEELDDPISSGGKRAYLLRAIVEFVLAAPLTGSGYLGVWSAFGDAAGSAHNQYLDVLFRTGLAGFAAYCYLLVLLARYLRRDQPALFWGFIAVLVYGLFHETFKESQGAFIFAFLMGMLAQSHPERTELRPALKQA